MGSNTDVAGLQEVEVDHQALLNILSRYPGKFDVLRELIQNADDADARSVEIHFQTEEGTEKSQSGNPSDIRKYRNAKVRKWIIKNEGGNGFREEDWERLGKIAAGNDHSAKVGAFGVGFYSVLSKSDRPLVRSNGKSLQFERGEDGRLRKRSATCSSDPLTTVELELRNPEALPVLADLTSFLVASVAFLAKIESITVHLDTHSILQIKKEVESPADRISVPQHLKPTSPLKALTVESIQRTVQMIAVSVDDWVFSDLIPSSPDADPNAIPQLQPRHPEDRPTRSFRSVDAITKKDNTIVYDLYTANTLVNLDEHSEMRESVESNVKSLPPSFACKAVYFNSEQCLTGIKHSPLPRAKQLHCLFCGSHGIFPENNSGRLFIGQSTSQTTGIGLHISAHFLPTMERGSIDLANGQVRAWNEEVLWIGGFLARVIYENEMDTAKSGADRAQHLGLCTMDRFAFDTTTPHSGVSQLLQDAFFSCCDKPKPPFPLVSDVGISCASRDPFRKHKKDLSFLKTYPVLHDEIERRQRSQIISRCNIPDLTFEDILQEFKNGVTQDMMRSFWVWWDRIHREATPSSKPVQDEFCEQFASFGVVHMSDGAKIALGDIKYFTFFPIPRDLSHPNSIYVELTQGVPTINAVKRFRSWTQLSLLVWLEHICSQARRHAPNKDSRQVSDVGYRILRALVLFALVEDLPPNGWKRAAELMKDFKCTPTNLGRELPAESYFDIAAVHGSLPIVQETDFLNIPATPVAGGGGFQSRFVDLKHVRKVLSHIGVCAMMDWRKLIKCLEEDASEESNYRFLRYLAAMSKNGSIDQDCIGSLKAKSVFFSEDRRRASATELLLPYEDVRRLGLPVLALRENGITSLQNDIDPSGAFQMEAFITETLGIQRYPTPNTIINQAASVKADTRQSALQYLLSNLDGCYKDCKPDEFAEVAFVPTKSGSLARPTEVFVSPVWEKLGFKLVSNDVRHHLSRLGVKEDPPVDKIIERLKTPERTLPDLKTAQLWFETLYSHGKLPLAKLRDELSAIPFVPVEQLDHSSSESSPVQYFSPKECFIKSDDTKEHYRANFCFVDFGQGGNGFLESCGTKKSPDASDLIHKIVKDPQGYLDLVKMELYFEDLRTIASKLDSISADDKRAMKETKMFPAKQNDKFAEKLFPAEQIFICDWAGRDFATQISIVPEKDDKLEKMYREMGSEFLGTNVQHDLTVGNLAESDLPVNHDKVIRCIRYFMQRRDKNRRTGDTFGEDSMINLEMKVCEVLRLEKTFRLPHGVSGEAVAAETVKTKTIEVNAGFETNEGGNTLWIVKGSSDSVGLRNAIAEALCHGLLKTYGPNDVLLLASLLGMDEKELDRSTPIEPSHPHPPDRKVKPTDEPDDELRLRIPLPAWMGKIRNLVHAPKQTLQQQVVSTDDDMAAVFAPWNAADSPNSEAPNLNPTISNQPRSTSGNQCKQSYNIRLREKKDLQDKETGIRFFMACHEHCPQPPRNAHEEFATLVSRLARVFGREASTSFCLFWKAKDEHLMGFNRDQKFIFLNLAHYCKFHYNKGLERKKVITDWYLVMAHEIAHMETMEHDEYHGLLSASIAVRYLPDLHRKFSEIQWENAPQPTSASN